MSINKDDIVQRKEQIMKDFETLTKEVEATENKIKPVSYTHLRAHET